MKEALMLFKSLSQAMENKSNNEKYKIFFIGCVPFWALFFLEEFKELRWYKTPNTHLQKNLQEENLGKVCFEPLQSQSNHWTNPHLP